MQDVLSSQAMCLAQEREEPRGTGRCSGTTSKELPSQQSGDWLGVEVWNVSLAWSTKRPEVSSRCSWRMSSGMQSPTLSTLAARQWQHSMLFMPSRDRAEHCTDLEDNFLHSTQTTPGDLNHHQFGSPIGTVLKLDSEHWPVVVNHQKTWWRHQAKKGIEPPAYDCLQCRTLHQVTAWVSL